LSLFVLAGVIIIIFVAPPAIPSGVTFLVADLADYVHPGRSTTTTTPTSRGCTPTTSTGAGMAIITAVGAAIISPIITAVTIGAAWRVGVAPAALARGVVGRRLELNSRGSMQQLLALIIRIQLGVEEAQGDGRRLGAKGSNEGVVVSAEASKDERHVITCGYWTSRGSEFVDETLHLGEIDVSRHV
jgi:hypothetical protein